ncbi:DUF6299 family protein [Streptomyces sp. NBC_00555]|uniref:DUF6299 family protein n=1 Tax=Streptomyces sp. NBC_00555 TaxID=2903662 RepID=UPI002259D153|nr:DUF6299 family protein [Streptomyces sp. NBC_00555]MCX5013444.1 DUF6299 family protein [Streptomyces sp. NBC_00555]
MGIHGTRMALAALSTLAATAVFTAPAGATSFDQGISVQPYGHISEDGKVTLSGKYHCTNPSPMGAKLQIAAAVVQGGTRLAFGGGEAECDGQEHEWEATGSLKFTPAVHPGPALAEAQLNEIHFSGLMPRSIDTVAEDRQEIRLIAHH